MQTIVRRERLILYALLTSLTALSIDALLTELRQIEADLTASTWLEPHHLVSLFIFGMVFGELCLGPISDAVGRKPALLGGLAVYGIGTSICLCVNSLEGVILGRILQGAGVSGPKIATRAMIRDQFQGDAMARVMSFLFTLFILVPMLAPAAGQWMSGWLGWRAIFTCYLIIGSCLGLWLWLGHPETLTPARHIPLSPRRLASNARRVLACPRVSLLIVATGLVFGAQLTFLSLAADVFADAFGLTQGFPYVFAGLAAGIGLASFVNGTLVERFGSDNMARWAFLDKKAAGDLQTFGSDNMARWGLILLTASGAAMATTSLMANGFPPLWVFLATGFLAFFAIGILFGNLNALAMADLGEVAGLGASLIASGSSLVATVFALIAAEFYAGTATPIGGAIFCAGGGALILFYSAARYPRKAPNLAA